MPWFITGLFFVAFFRINITMITKIKNMAVPMYAGKLLSGLGKKNKVINPISTIAGMRYLFFIFYPSRIFTQDYINVHYYFLFIKAVVIIAPATTPIPAAINTDFSGFS